MRVFAKLRRQCLTTLVQHIADDHLRARPQQGARKRFTQAARAARDQHLAANKRNFVIGGAHDWACTIGICTCTRPSATLTGKRCRSR